MNHTADFLAAARKTVPSLSDQQWLAWLQQVERLGGVLTLPIDGGPVSANYPRRTLSCLCHASANGVQP